MRRQVTDQEKIFTKDISNKVLFSTIYSKLLRLNNKGGKKEDQRPEQTHHQRSYTDGRKACGIIFSTICM